MKCVICGSKFYNTSFSSPAEPCDCGACLTANDTTDWPFVYACRIRVASGEEITDDRGNFIEPVEVGADV